MATIETAEGQTLIVEGESDNPRLHVKVKADVEDVTRHVEIEDSAYSFYADSADTHESRPRSRGDLTAEVMEDLANRAVGRIVAETQAQRRSHVDIINIEVQERSPAKNASRAYVPEWEDDWPENGSKTEQVAFMLECDTSFSDEQVAAGAGCSRSLVNEVKSSLEGQ